MGLAAPVQTTRLYRELERDKSTPRSELGSTQRYVRFPVYGKGRALSTEDIQI